jgi:hypothetical protein
MSLMIVRSRWRQYVCTEKATAMLSLEDTRVYGNMVESYKTVCNHIVLLQNRRGHLCVHMVVMGDKVMVAHLLLFADEDGCFDDFTKACG